MTQRLCNKLLDQSTEPFEITNAYSCFTTDVVTSYCFGQKKGFLDQPEFTPNLRPAIIGGCQMLPTVRQWPNLFGLVQSLPEYVWKEWLTEHVLTNCSSVAALISSDIALFNKNMNVSSYVLPLWRSH